MADVRKNCKDLSNYVRVEHNIPPVFNSESRVLVLGSLPSVKSREAMFFYGHPQNRFWKVIASVAGEREPVSVEEKKALLLKNRIAVWDVIKSCDIIGSSDASIRNAEPNDIGLLLNSSNVSKVFANGGTAYKLYTKYCLPATNQEAVRLSSTSPANAAFSLERLVSEWGGLIKPWL